MDQGTSEDPSGMGWRRRPEFVARAAVAQQETSFTSKINHNNNKNE